jgi:hypothetical protein
MTILRPAALAAAFFALALSTGCNSDDGRLEVSGKITFKSAPLDSGTIVFVSADGRSQASAVITGGAYRIPKPQGLAAGTYKVSITSPDGKTPDADPNAPPGPGGNFASKDRIPKAFNTESKVEVEVKKGDPNVFDFTIP